MSRPLAFLAAAALVLPLGSAAADTECALGSPTPGFKVIRLDLPQGSSYLGIELTDSGRASRPVETGDSWHFARGIMVLDSSYRLVAYRIAQSGTAPKALVVANEDTRVRQEAPGVDGPFVHTASRLVPKLAPGTYYAVGFGVDGNSRNPNEYWTASVRVQGAHPCTSVATGSTFDLDHTKATGGTQIAAPNVGYAEGASIEYTTSRSVSVGILDCSVQFASSASEAECSADLPGVPPFEVEDEIVPVVFGPGTATVTFEHQGVSPVVAFSGASWDLL